MCAPQVGKHADVRFGTRIGLWMRRTNLLKKRCHKMSLQQSGSVHSTRQSKTCCIMRWLAATTMTTISGPGAIEEACDVASAPIFYPNTSLCVRTVG